MSGTQLSAALFAMRMPQPSPAGLSNKGQGSHSGVRVAGIREAVFGLLPYLVGHVRRRDENARLGTEPLTHAERIRTHSPFSAVHPTKDPARVHQQFAPAAAQVDAARRALIQLLRPRQDGAAGRRRARRARLYVRWHDDVLMRREDPLAVLQLLLQRVRPLVKRGGQLLEGAHGIQAAQEAKVRDEDRVGRTACPWYPILRAHGIHTAEALVARSEEDVVSAAVPLPEVGHGALQVVRSHLDIGRRAFRVAGLTVGCEEWHEKEVSRVRVECAHCGVAQQRVQEAPLGRVHGISPVVVPFAHLVGVRMNCRGASTELESE
eukprot:scaffold1548_cov50-Phaeocystis_antarctica.AAC.3